MKYYRIEVKCNSGIYRLGIAHENNIPSKEYLNDLVYEFLKSQKVHINGNEIINLQESNEKEFNELKCNMKLELHFKETCQVRY